MTIERILDQLVVMHTGSAKFLLTVDGTPLMTARGVQVRWERGLAIISLELLTRSFTTCHHDPEDTTDDSAHRV